MTVSLAEPMTAVSVVHLVSSSFGPEPLRRFAGSYREHDAGVDHELVVLFNGFTDPAALQAHAALIEGLAHRRVDLPAVVLDLLAYRDVLDTVAGERVCFLNSNARPLVSGWLQRLTAPLDDPTVGLTGATGSWESAASSAPAQLKLQNHLAFPRFPNPHLRSNGFAGSRALLRELEWGDVRDKRAAHRLESGRHSLTRQVQARGLRTVLAGRDGRCFDPDDWPASGTFRTGGQANLVIADNRTDDYADADAAERRRLGRMAWGRAWVDGA